MTARVNKHRLQVAGELAEFIETEALPGTGIDAAAFWEGLSRLAHDIAPKNRELLDTRAVLQGKIDAWHRAHPGPITNPAAYRAFLEEIGYIPPKAPISRSTRRTLTPRSPPSLARNSSSRLPTPATH